MRSARVITRVSAALLLTAGLYAQTPAPTLLSINPVSARVGTQGLSLTVTGTNFRVGSALTWNQTILTTSLLVGSTQLTASIPSVLLAQPGTANIGVVNPGGARSNSIVFTITGSLVTVSTNSLPQGAIGTAYAVALAASGGTPPYIWSVSGTLPPGLVMSPGGVISGTPTQAGTFNFDAQVTDAANQSGTKAFSIVITAPALSITTTSPLPRGTVGQPYRLTFSAANGTAPYRWQGGEGVPPGLTLDASGTISGTPTTSGAFTFPVRAIDSRDVFVTQTFAVTIDPSPLVITTVSPLFNATVGISYAQTLSASGGAPPYRWEVTSGDTAGLTLEATSGVLQGTPRTAGTILLNVRVTDSTGASVSRAFSITVNPPTLTIPSPSTLPNGSVGANYTYTFTVVGGTAPYTWSLSAGNVPGLTFDATSATLSGIPSVGGAFPFSLSVRDVNGATATRTFTITITAAALRITSDIELPNATLAADYSHTMNATGGSAPYIWSATGLPEGLAIDTSTGFISGAPAAAGTYAFTVRVTDSVRATFIELFRLTVNLPPAPTATLSGLPETADPAQQFPLQVSLNTAFPALISGQAILSFAPDSGVGDNTIQFSSGGRTANFTIPANSLNPQSTTPLAIQTGTVAGTITVSLRLTAGGIDITSTPAPTARVRIERRAPVIQSARLIRNANGFGIEIIGSSTAREVTQASFTFSASSGQTLQTGTVVVPVENLFSTWYQNPSSAEFGSQFVFTQLFNVQGDSNAVSPQNVTLTNRVGSVTVPVQQ